MQKQCVLIITKQWPLLLNPTNLLKDPKTPFFSGKTWRREKEARSPRCEHWEGQMTMDKRLYSLHWIVGYKGKQSELWCCQKYPSSLAQNAVCVSSLREAFWMMRGWVEHCIITVLIRSLYITALRGQMCMPRSRTLPRDKLTRLHTHQCHDYGGYFLKSLRKTPFHKVHINVNTVVESRVTTTT